MKRALLLAVLVAGPMGAATALVPPGRTASVRRWDAVGHRAMAALAYDRLRPATRARVDALLRQHPDIAALGMDLDVASAAGIREVFLRASVWPDRIRNDPRFFRETDPNAARTPLLPGFPTMERHEEWHYLTRSFSTDGTPTIALGAPNVAQLFPLLADGMNSQALSPGERAYYLSWVIHVVGDLHQPLHGTSRSTADAPAGDAGGNRVWVQLRGDERDSVNLHSVWDGWVGRPSRGVAIDDVAQSLASALPPPAPGSAELHIPVGTALARTFLAWADESATLARYVAYDLPPREGGAPPMLSDDYVRRGELIARQRLALAAYRLAAVIESRLGD